VLRTYLFIVFCQKITFYHILAIISLVHVVTYDWFRSLTPHMLSW